MNTVMRTLGGALGGAALGDVHRRAHASTAIPAVTGFTESFVMATGFLVVCLISGFLVPRAQSSAGTVAALPRLDEAGAEAARRQPA